MSCRNCFSGFVREGETTGEILTKYGLPTYVAKAPSDDPRGVIVIVPDAFGWEFNVMRLYADIFAAKVNATVYLPEFMNGRPASLAVMPYMEGLNGTGLWANIRKIKCVAMAAYYLIPFFIYNRPSVVRPRMHSFLKGLREEMPDTPIGVVGYCWGGRYAVQLTHSTSEQPEPLVDVCYTAHPSALAIPGDIEAILKPVSIAVGSKDIVLPITGIKKVQGALQKSPVPHEVVIYEGATHGFSTRTDFTDPTKEKQANEAEAQGTAWLIKYLKK